MNFSSLQSSVQKFGMNQALKYLEKDPETNIPKLMNLVDKVMPEGWYGSQRKLIREQIDEKGVWYDYILKLYDLDAGVRQTVFKNFIFNASLNGSTKQEELSEKYNCNIPWAVLLDPTSACNLHCTGKKGEKALVMANMEENAAEQDIFDFGREIEVKPEVVAKFKPETVKGSQFKQPLLEFSGACAGCGETPYAKLITQLFGDRMYIANATGCSSIWGNSSPSTPYTMNSKGQGPAWSNSLFEDNAEFGYGMLLAQKAIRKRLKEEVETVAASEQASAEVKAACQEYLDTFACGITNGDATDKLVAALDGCDCDTCKDIVKNKDFLAKKSQWIFGGDGWAYDIGFGGVDHVLASGEDINIMVFDTEVYSTQVDSLLRLLRLVLQLSSQQAEKRRRRKTLQAWL